MSRPAVCAVLLCCMVFTVNAAEWEAARYALGAHAGYAGPVNENATPGLRLSVTGSLSIPLIVEQHLLITPLVSFHYQPMIAPEEVGLVGGNFLTGSVAFLIEHDITVGDQLGWYGAGPQISLNATAGQFEWMSTGTGSKAVEIDDELSVSADLLARLGIDFSSHYTAWLTGQYSPMPSGYTGVSVGASYKF